MSTDVSTTKHRRGACTCTSGHLSHMTRAAATRCDLERARKVAAKRARLIFRPIPADQRDDARALPGGAFDWKGFWVSIGSQALGYGAVVVGSAAVLAAVDGLLLAVQWAIRSGHDGYMWAALAGLAVVLFGVWVVRQPKVRRAWAWLREVYE